MTDQTDQTDQPVVPLTPDNLGWQWDPSGYEATLPLFREDDVLAILADLDNDDVPCPPVADVPAYVIDPPLPTLTGEANRRSLRAKKLLRAALGYIEAHPDEHEQEVWRCDTGMCLFGWVGALMPNWDWADRFDRELGDMWMVRTIGGHPAPSGTARTVDAVVCDLLIGDDNEDSHTADKLSYGDNTIPELKVLVDQYLRDLPLVRPVRNGVDLDEQWGYDDNGVNVWEGATWWADRDVDADSIFWDATLQRFVEREDA